jgi:hypothetical protein
MGELGVDMLAAFVFSLTLFPQLSHATDDPDKRPLCPQILDPQDFTLHDVEHNPVPALPIWHHKDLVGHAHNGFPGPGKAPVKFMPGTMVNPRLFAEKPDEMLQKKYAPPNIPEARQLEKIFDERDSSDREALLDSFVDFQRGAAAMDGGAQGVLWSQSIRDIYLDELLPLWTEEQVKSELAAVHNYMTERNSQDVSTSPPPPLLLAREDALKRLRLRFHFRSVEPEPILASRLEDIILSTPNTLGLGSRLPNGLLVGPPSNGKTNYGKAFASLAFSRGGLSSIGKADFAKIWATLALTGPIQDADFDIPDPLSGLKPSFPAPPDNSEVKQALKIFEERDPTNPEALLDSFVDFRLALIAMSEESRSSLWYVPLNESFWNELLAIWPEDKVKAEQESVLSYLRARASQGPTTAVPELLSLRENVLSAMLAYRMPSAAGFHRPILDTMLMTPLPTRSTP